MDVQKAFVLVGKSYSGKTTALTRLISALKERDDFEELVRIETGKTDTHDFISILRHHELTIGITTRGDSAEHLTVPFKKFKLYNCSYVVCASHETKAMFSFLDKHCKAIDYTYSLYFWDAPDSKINKKIDENQKHILQKLLKEVVEKK